MTTGITTELLPLTARPAWKALEAHYKNVAGLHLRALFGDDATRGERLTAEEPVGRRHVLVNGTPIRRDEVQLDSSVRPGMRPELG